MNIVVNGENVLCGDGATVLDLLRSRKVRPEVVVVERNRYIVEQKQFASVALCEGDRLEILHFVGGG